MGSNEASGTPGIVYFHGAASARDLGPDDVAVEDSGVHLIRHVRPGYDRTPPATNSTLREIAAAALDDARAQGIGPLAALGWSGGGPYALAAGSLGRPEVRAVALVASWAPMEPPHPGLPSIVRLFMHLGRRSPRPLLSAALAAGGRRTPGHVDDIRRVARPWGFDVAGVASSVPVAAWHASADREVPCEPWADRPDLSFHRTTDAGHVPSHETWAAAITWAASLVANP